MILDAIATFHLTYATAKMLKAVIPREILPIDSAYGGKFKYLTFWNAVSKTYLWNSIGLDLLFRRYILLGTYYTRKYRYSDRTTKK